MLSSPKGLALGRPQLNALRRGGARRGSSARWVIGHRAQAARSSLSPSYFFSDDSYKERAERDSHITQYYSISLSPAPNHHVSQVPCSEPFRRAITGSCRSHLRPLPLTLQRTDTGCIFAVPSAGRVVTATRPTVVVSAPALGKSAAPTACVDAGR